MTCAVQTQEVEPVSLPIQEQQAVTYIKRSQKVIIVKREKNAILCILKSNKNVVIILITNSINRRIRKRIWIAIPNAQQFNNEKNIQNK